MTRVLITGAAGLIGSRLGKYLKQNYDYDVVGIDDFSGGLEENIDDSFTDVFPYNIVKEQASIEAIFKHDGPFDIVFHAAAYAAECLSPFIRQFNYTNNLVATAQIVNLCIKYNVGRLVFCSSNSVYGRGTPPFSEETQPRPIDPYAVAKYASEMDIQIAHEQHGLEYCILRLHNVLGIGQNIFDPYRNVAGIFIYKGLVGDPITVYGDGTQIRAFSEVSDILEPLHKACANELAANQIINLGGIEQVKVYDIADVVRELSGADIIYLPERHEVKHAFPTWEKSEQLLGFHQQSDWRESIKSMWEWASTLEMRPRQIWSSYELNTGIYPQWKQETLVDGFWKSNADTIAG